MEFTNEMKEKAEKAETKDEKKALIENTRMLMTNDELDKISGGIGISYAPNIEKDA